MVKAVLRLIVGLILTRNLTVDGPLIAVGPSIMTQLTGLLAEKSQFCGAVTLTVNSPPFVGILIEPELKPKAQTVGFCSAVNTFSRPPVLTRPDHAGSTSTVLRIVAFNDAADSDGS